MKAIDKTEIMEKTLNLYLGRILAHICKFLKIYKEKPNSMENILNVIYLHPISKSKKKIEKFLSIIEKAELNYKEKIIDIKEASDMKKKELMNLAK